MNKFFFIFVSSMRVDRDPRENVICTFFDVFGRFLPRPVLHTHPFPVSNEPARPYATAKPHKFIDHVQTTYYRIVWDIVDAL